MLHRIVQYHYLLEMMIGGYFLPRIEVYLVPISNVLLIMGQFVDAGFNGLYCSQILENGPTEQYNWDTVPITIINPIWTSTSFDATYYTNNNKNVFLPWTTTLCAST
jgi:hypothetical protein